MRSLMFLGYAAVLVGCGGGGGEIDASFDAGPDARRLDASVEPDAGTSGPDGATIDATTLDGAALDGATTLDGAALDGAARDGAASDGAPPDAARPDGPPPDAPAPVTLTVTRTGLGTGAVTWPGGTCGVGCTTTTTVHPYGTTLDLDALPTNGTSSLFDGWAGACGGLVRRCTLTLTADTAVTAGFATHTANLAFVTSTVHPMNLGGLAPYDALCNARATEAGINVVSNDGFVAWMSTTTETALSRLGVARGWVRLDGLPFADGAAALATNNARIYYPVVHDDTGADLTGGSVATGTRREGIALAGMHCADFTSTLGELGAGEIGGGPFEWTQGDIGHCDESLRLLCLGRTTTTVVVPTPVAGKQLWLTSSPHELGTSTPDAHCDAQKPSGVGATHAVLATSTRAAGARLEPATRYVRPDGVEVGLGETLLARGTLRAGYWLQADGTYAARTHWIGADDLTSPGTATCTDWTSAAPALGAAIGYGGRILMDTQWPFLTSACDADGVRLLCVED